ncbi:MAG: hypothetical protein QJR08_05955 [Bacillota bacterium]|nr:hypothetical protein [Bacillota bacterium]
MEKLTGPLPLETDQLDRLERKPGVFVLYDGAGNVTAWGRDDADLPARLRTFGSPHRAFAYRLTETSKEAFTLECILYHEAGGAFAHQGLEHPERPAGHSWRCPICSLYD